MLRGCVRAVVLALVLALALPVAATATGVSEHHAKPLLHVGSRGKRVAALQWLLAGKDPSVFKGVHVRKQRPTGEFGKRTAQQVKDAKWLLGYPKADVVPLAGRTLFDYLTGAKPRPLGYAGRAALRIKVIARQRASRAPPCARRVVAIARHELGVVEQPWGSNYGPRISGYEAVTGAYYAPWCASFVQFVYRQAGIGTIADRSAGVFYIVDWARRRGWLRSRPKVGAAVAYLSSLGHIGIVQRVTRHGFWTVEGNSSNGVRERWHPLGYARTVFVYPSCLR